MRKIVYILVNCLLCLACQKELSVSDDVFISIDNVASLSDFSQYSYPEMENTWIITDQEASLESLQGLCSALKAAQDREISLEFVNLVEFPSSISFEIAPFRDIVSLVSVSLPKATSIGSWVFFESNSLREIYAPKLNYVGEYAFYNNQNLENIVCSSVLSVGDYAFYLCSNLASVYPLEQEITSSSETIGCYAFYECDSLRQFPMWSVSEVGEASFYGCNVLSDLNFLSLSKMGEKAFYNCYALSEIILPMLSVLPNSAFRGCSSLISVVAGMCGELHYDALTKCKNLTTLELSTSLNALLSYVDEGCFTGSNTQTKPSSISLSLGAYSKDFTVVDKQLDCGDYSIVFKEILLK
ncbi:MAG: leucine-rich repeat domain-containing protein [Rikenellaceae bacterium]